MARVSDPTDAIRRKAATFPAVAEGTSCNQTSFKAGKSAFLYIGPGAKGQGFKAKTAGECLKGNGVIGDIKS